MTNPYGISDEQFAALKEVSDLKQKRFALMYERWDIEDKIAGAKHGGQIPDQAWLDRLDQIKQEEHDIAIVRDEAHSRFKKLFANA